MKRRILRKRLLPPVLIAASVLVGLGCGVVNPGLLGGTASTSTTAILNQGVVVVMLINNTSATGQVSFDTNQTINGTTGDVTTTLIAPANDHLTWVRDCDFNTINVVQASYAGTNGAVIVPSTVSPVTMRQNIQCGGGVVLTLSGTPPGVFLNATSF
jgi:hypothetical protein